MLRDASDFGIDGSLLEGFTMDDIDTGTLKAYKLNMNCIIRSMCGTERKIKIF